MAFDGYKITSPFGPRKDPFTAKDAYHTGIDLVKSHKAPIEAFVGGSVLFAGATTIGTGLGGLGNVVAILDPKGALHIYAHLDSVSVKIGDKISKGKVLGKQGSTGRSTGSHLHYEIRKTSKTSYGWRTGKDYVYSPTEYLKKYNDGPTVGPIFFIVKDGDTLSRIAKDHNLSLDQILKLNPQVKNPEIIHLGDKIKIG